MGCDIHPVILTRFAPKSDIWRASIIPDNGRYYEFFGTLAVVRSNTYEPIFEPRGLPVHVNPDDYSAFVTGDHTASWFTLTEAREYLREATWNRYTEPELWDRWTSWIADMEYAKKYGYGHERLNDDDIMVVFNFDS